MDIENYEQAAKSETEPCILTYSYHSEDYEICGDAAVETVNIIEVTVNEGNSHVLKIRDVLRKAIFLIPVAINIKQIVEILLKICKWIEVQKPVCVACENIQLCLDRLINCKNKCQQTPLHIFAKNNCIDELNALLQLEADISKRDFEGKTPLTTAILSRSWAAATVLLECKAGAIEMSHCEVLINHTSTDFQYTGQLDDDDMVVSKSPAAVKVINAIFQHSKHERGDWRDDEGNTPTHLFSNFTEETIALRSEVNAQNFRGQTPLHVAVICRDIERMTLLMKHGADFRITDELMNTPLHHVLWVQTHFITQMQAVLSKYLQHGLDQPRRNIFGQISPIHRLKPTKQSCTDIVFDNLENSELHVAAGAYLDRPYGDLMKCWQTLSSHENASDFEVQNIFGQTPLHVLASKGVLCIGWSAASNESLTKVDGMGRNAVHIACMRLSKNNDVFNSRRCRELRLGSQPDGYGRYPLHYAAMHQTCLCVSSERKSIFTCDKCLNRFKTSKTLSAKDNFGRIPLHYACASGHDINELTQSYLPSSATDENLKDLDGITPNTFRRQRDQFGGEDSREEDFGVMVDESFSDFSVMQKYLGKTPVWQLWMNRTELIPNVRNAHDIDNTTHIDLLPSDFMKRLADAIGEEDPRFHCEVMGVGSAFDGTRLKIFEEPDEFDFSIVLKNFGDMCEVAQLTTCPIGYAVLKKRSDASNIDDAYSDFFHDDMTLNTTKLNFDFQKTMVKVLSWQKFWKNEMFLEYTDRAILHKIEPNKLRKVLSLATSRAINGRTLYNHFSIDVVPCIRIPGWWHPDARPATELSPEKAVQEQLLNEGCIFVLDQPYRKYRIPYSTTQFVKISFARAEYILINSLPPVARAAQILSKTVWEFVTTKLLNMKPLYTEFNQLPRLQSFAFKTGLFYSLNEHPELACPGSQLSQEGVEMLVESVFRHVYQFAQQDYIPQYMMPSFRSTIYKFEEYLGFSHAALTKRSMTYQQLFDVDTGNLETFSELKNIKTMLLLTYIAYISVCKHGDRCPQWTFPVINK